VHDEKLTSLSATVHFVCADFKNTDGLTYDIDIFMEGTDKENLKTTDVKVHKKSGKPRYAWYEEAGVWKTKEIAVAKPQELKPKAEHPEHPAKSTDEQPEHPEHPN